MLPFLDKWKKMGVFSLALTSLGNFTFAHDNFFGSKDRLPRQYEAKTIEDLIQDLSASEQRTRTQAINRLANRGRDAQKAFEKLESFLGDPDLLTFHVENVINALVKIWPSRALGPLLATLNSRFPEKRYPEPEMPHYLKEDPGGYNRQMFGALIKSLGEIYANSLENKALLALELPEVTRILEANLDFTFFGLQPITDMALFELEEFESPQPKTFSSTVIKMYRSERKRKIDQSNLIVSALTKKSVSERSSAYHDLGLAQQKSAAIIRTLETGLQDPIGPIAEHSALSLLRLNAIESIDPLVAFLKRTDVSKFKKITGIMALRSFYEPPYKDSQREALLEALPRVREQLRHMAKQTERLFGNDILVFETQMNAQPARAALYRVREFERRIRADQ